MSPVERGPTPVGIGTEANAASARRLGATQYAKRAEGAA